MCALDCAGVILLFLGGKLLVELAMPAWQLAPWVPLAVIFTLLGAGLVVGTRERRSQASLASGTAQE